MSTWALRSSRSGADPGSATAVCVSLDARLHLPVPVFLPQSRAIVCAAAEGPWRWAVARGPWDMAALRECSTGSGRHHELLGALGGVWGSCKPGGGWDFSPLAVGAPAGSGAAE